MSEVKIRFIPKSEVTRKRPQDQDFDTYQIFDRLEQQRLQDGIPSIYELGLSERALGRFQFMGAATVMGVRECLGRWKIPKLGEKLQAETLEKLRLHQERSQSERSNI